MRTVLASLTVGLPLAIAAFMFQVRRWLLYAAILTLATILEFATGAHFGVGWLVAGGGVLVIGFFVLMAFLQKHPVRSDPKRTDA